MAKQRFNGDLAKNILTTLARSSMAAGLVVGLAVMPGLGFVAKELIDLYQKGNSHNRFRMRRTFEQLKKDRLIKFEVMPDGNTKMILTENGKKFILKYDIENIKIKKPTKWDGLWRFVIFDIPNTFSRERRYFRLKLKAIGFYQLQKSVWIYPYKCKNEIDFASEYLRVSPFVRLLEVTNFEGSDDICKHFFD